MLQMYELCYDYINYQGAKEKLLEFQKCLLNVRAEKSLSTSFYVFILYLSSGYVNCFPCQALGRQTFQRCFDIMLVLVFGLVMLDESAIHPLPHK